MESVETYHAETIFSPLKLNSYFEMIDRHSVVKIERLPRYEKSKFTPHSRIHWIEGSDLISKTRKWLPYELVHLDFRLPEPCGHGHFVRTSNGLASGNTPEEAQVHGICEVIETDAFTLWELKSPEEKQLTKVRNDSVENLQCIELLDKIAKSETIVGIWNITSDVGIPAFLCRILSSSGVDSITRVPALGIGCHPLKEVALTRALTEAAQSRLTFISGTRDDLKKTDYDRRLTLNEYIKWECLIQSEGFARFSAIPSFKTESVSDDLKTLMRSLERVGIEEIISVDLTKKEFEIPVVRIVIPGMESPLMHVATFLGERATSAMKWKLQT